MGDAMKKDYDRITEDLAHKYNVVPDQWVSLYPKMNMKKREMTYIAAVSDEGLHDVDLSPDYVRGEVKPGKALEIKHDGAYDFIGNAWSMGVMYLRSKKIKQSGTPFEKYWNNPRDVSPEELQTSIYFPLKG